MSTSKKVLENSFLYTFSSLLVKGISFLLLPIYTTFLTPEEYGTVNLITSFNSVAMYIVAFSLYSSVVRFYADYKDNLEKLRRFYGTVILFIFASGITFLSLSFIFKDLLVSWFFEGIPFYPLVIIGLLTFTFLSLHMIHQNILQSMQLGKKLTKINLMVFGLQIFITLLFIVVLNLGALGFLLAIFIINFGYSIFMIWDLKNNNLINFRIDLKILKEALKYSIPLMPHNLSTQIASFFSRVILNNSTTLASVGLLSIANQFGTIIDTIQTSVNKAFAPWFFDIMKNNSEESRKDVVKLSQFLLLIYSLVYMIIGLFSQEVIILLINERYIMAWTVIPIFVIAFSVKSIYYFYVNVLFYYKDASRKIFIATLLGSFADIFFALLLIPYWGMHGSALAFLIAKILVTSIVIILSKRYDDIGYRLPEMLKIIITSLLFMGVGLYFSYTQYMTFFSWENLIYKVLVLVIYLILIYIFNRKLINRIVVSGKIQKVLLKKKI